MTNRRLGIIFFSIHLSRKESHLDGLVEVSDDSLEVDGDEGIAIGGGLLLGMAPKIMIMRNGILFQKLF